MNLLMKRLIAVVMCVLLAAMLAACGGVQGQISDSGASVDSSSSNTNEGVGGEIDVAYEGQFQRRLRHFNGELSYNTCGDQAFYDWVDSFNKLNGEQDPSKRPNEEITLITFIKEFNISKEDFMRYQNVDTGEGQSFTDAEVDLMYTGTKAQQIAAFANPCAVIIGEKIYSPEWVVEHSLEEVQAAGITYEMLEEKTALWEEQIWERYLPRLMEVKQQLFSER